MTRKDKHQIEREMVEIYNTIQDLRRERKREIAEAKKLLKKMSAVKSELRKDVGRYIYYRYPALQQLRAGKHLFSHEFIYTEKKIEYDPDIYKILIIKQQDGMAVKLVSVEDFKKKERMSEWRLKDVDAGKFFTLKPVFEPEIQELAEQLIISGIITGDDADRIKKKLDRFAELEKELDKKKDRINYSILDKANQLRIELRNHIKELVNNNYYVLSPTIGIYESRKNIDETIMYYVLIDKELLNKLNLDKKELLAYDLRTEKLMIYNRQDKSRREVPAFMEEYAKKAVFLNTSIDDFMSYKVEEFASILAEKQNPSTEQNIGYWK